MPLLGPERTLVKASANGNPYQAWAAGVRSGNVVVSNGPLVEIELDAAKTTATARASFYRPLERLEIVINGAVAAAVPGDKRRTSLRASIHLPADVSCWVAAHVVAQKLAGEPDIQAHTNPICVIRDGKKVALPAARAAVAARWDKEVQWYRSAQLAFPGEREKREFFDFADRATRELAKPQGNARR